MLDLSVALGASVELDVSAALDVSVALDVPRVCAALSARLVVLAEANAKAVAMMMSENVVAAMNLDLLMC